MKSCSAVRSPAAEVAIPLCYSRVVSFTSRGQPALRLCARLDCDLPHMALQTTFDEVQAMLAAADQGLRDLSLEQIEQLCQNDDSLSDERLWPSTLRSRFFDATPIQRKELHWIVETHYGALVRDATGDDFWRLSALAYTRVIPLRLGYDESMGHRSADSIFVVRSVRRIYPTSPLRSLRLLDVGCGTGELLADLALVGFTALEGIDVSRAATSRAAKRVDGSGAIVRCVSLRRLLEEEPASLYDVVTLCDVLEHLPRSDVPEILCGLRRRLSPAGLLVVVTPSAITGPHDLDFLPRGCATGGLHLHEYRLRELRSVLHQAGFASVQSTLLNPSGRWFATPSRSAFLVKLALERILDRTPFSVATRFTEAFYFRGIVCRRA